MIGRVGRVFVMSFTFCGWPGEIMCFAFASSLCSSCSVRVALVRKVLHMSGTHASTPDRQVVYVVLLGFFCLCLCLVAFFAPVLLTLAPLFFLFLVVAAVKPPAGCPSPRPSLLLLLMLPRPRPQNNCPFFPTFWRLDVCRPLVLFFIAVGPVGVPRVQHLTAPLAFVFNAHGFREVVLFLCRGERWKVS